MLKKRVANLFGARAAKERAQDPSAQIADWAAGPGELEAPRKSISRVTNETFESELDELDRVFAEGTTATRSHGHAPFDLESFSPDEQLVDPQAFRESLPPEPLPPPPPAPPVQRAVEPPRARSRRDTVLPWPATVEEPKNVPYAPIVTQAIPAWPPVPVDRPSAPPSPAPASATPVRLEVPQPATPEAPAGQPLVAGLRSKQDIVNAFKNLLAAERSEAEARATLVPGANSTVAEITLPKSINPTTLRLKLEPRTDAEGRTVLSITVE